MTSRLAAGACAIDTESLDFAPRLHLSFSVQYAIQISYALYPITSARSKHSGLGPSFAEPCH